MCILLYISLRWRHYNYYYRWCYVISLGNQLTHSGLVPCSHSDVLLYIIQSPPHFLTPTRWKCAFYIIRLARTKSIVFATFWFVLFFCLSFFFLPPVVIDSRDFTFGTYAKTNRPRRPKSDWTRSQSLEKIYIYIYIYILCRTFLRALINVIN